MPTKRLLGLAVIGFAGGLLAIIGFSAPWLTWTYSLLGRPPQSASADPWDVMTHAIIEGVQFSPTAYAYLAMFGCILSFVGALSCLATPRNKVVWLVLTSGGILAVLGAALALFQIETGPVLAGTIEFNSAYGVFLTLVGGLLSLVGFRGLSLTFESPV